MKYRPVIGLEIHVELKTRTKMFCGSLNDSDEKHPNINVCPICMGHPGCLPVINGGAIKKVIMAGLALNCKIAEDTFFERKSYFYPDLPKGYQISQYQKPLCENGYLDIGDPSAGAQDSKRIRITRIHLEEDAGRLYHDPKNNATLIDYNRAGVPLMELVTEPDFESGEEVREFAEELQLILRYLMVSDASMEKGEMRIEVNVSLSLPAGSDRTPAAFGTKVEVKNINSIKFAADAVDYEIKRQTEILEAGESIKRETRGWDEFKQQTFSQRSKEEAHDYRYFPEPDLPPIKIRGERSAYRAGGQEASGQIGIYIEDIRPQITELPRQRRERFVRQYGLPGRDIEVFVADKLLGDYYEHVASELISFDKLGHLKRPESEHQNKLLKLASNYLITELKRRCDEISAGPADTKITPEMFADLIVRIFHGEVSSSGGQAVLQEMFATGTSPGRVIKEKNLEQISNVEELNLAAGKAVADNPKAVEDYKKGKEASLKFLIGMTMKGTKGRANPLVVEEILKNMLR